MPSVFLVSDTHFGHTGVCRFTRADGVTKLRPWDSAEEMDEEMVRRWNALFTPTMMFFPSEVPEDVTATQAAVAVMPGAFGRWTTLNLLNWIAAEGYNGDETFQRYHARIIQEQGIIE